MVRKDYAADNRITRNSIDLPPTVWSSSETRKPVEIELSLERGELALLEESVAINQRRMSC